jgi:adenylate kinase family enzyme
MRRVSVVGNSGSGKTTVARVISCRLGLPYLELDAVYHQPGWAARPDPEMREIVADFVRGDRWVVDGNYTSSGVAEIVWSGADTLIWLDLPRPVVIRQVIRRTLRRVLTREELWSGNREQWSNVFDPRPEHNIIAWAWSRDRHVRDKYEKRLGDGTWSHLDVVRLGSRDDVSRFLSAL